MKRVLLTGASGFIGRQAIAPLLARGYEVHAVSTGAHADSKVQWHQADLFDVAQSAALVQAIRPTHLLHFAWYAVPGKYWTAPENRRWVDASIALLHAFQRGGGQRVVMAGTCAEYDWKGGHCDEETTPLQPATLYGQSKHALQTALSADAQQAGLSSAWGRIFSLYGPHEYPSRLVASVILALLRGEAAQCTEGSAIRDYLHVVDVASAFVALLDSAVQGAVNIGAGHGVALKEVVDTLGKKIARPDLIQRGALLTPASEPPLLLASTARLQAIGWVPHYTLDSGLDDTIAWWRSRV